MKLLKSMLSIKRLFFSIYSNVLINREIEVCDFGFFIFWKAKSISLRLKI